MLVVLNACKSAAQLDMLLGQVAIAVGVGDTIGDIDAIVFATRFYSTPWRRASRSRQRAEIHMFGTQGYRWVLDADIEACFDRIDHVALMDRVRVRIKDKRVLRLVKAFLKAGILAELGDIEDTHTGTPQGGILSQLLANIALSVLDEHLHAPWKPGGEMSTRVQRAKRVRHREPNWRIVRHADDFVVLVRGERHHVEGLREEIARVLSPIGLNLSEAKTQTVHMSEGFDFLGFHIRWRRKRGTNKWYVYTFIGERPFRSVNAKIREAPQVLCRPYAGCGSRLRAA